ncbi:MAG: ATP-binding protein, partial [Deltaproteobacteria bacterium]|nr:ATP-binding protein [Deltaproteobacteria bacterium]
MYPYYQRLVKKRLLRLFQSFSVVVVSGARQVGKSRLLQELFPNLPCITFDPVMDIENAKADPDLFLRNRKPPVILDEIQYVPNLVPAIKRMVDKDKKPAQFLITGSQQWEVMKNLSESLAGRVVFLDLESFALKEIYQTTEQSHWLERWLSQPSLEMVKNFQPPQRRRALYEQLWRGFLPEAHFLELENIPDFLSAYQRTYIERDVRQIAEIENFEIFGRFFKLCGALTAQEINHS